MDLLKILVNGEFPLRFTIEPPNPRILDVVSFSSNALILYSVSKLNVKVKVLPDRAVSGHIWPTIATPKATYSGHYCPPQQTCIIHSLSGARAKELRSCSYFAAVKRALILNALKLFCLSFFLLLPDPREAAGIRVWWEGKSWRLLKRLWVTDGGGEGGVFVGGFGVVVML